MRLLRFQHRSSVRLLLLILIILVVNGHFSLNAYAAYPVKSTTPARVQSAKTVANFNAMPNWWRKEYIRRQQMARMERWQRAQRIQIYNREMSNPRSPQRLAYQRAFTLAHRNLRSAEHNAAISKITNRS